MSKTNARHLKINTHTALGDEIKLKSVTPIYEGWKDNKPVGEAVAHKYTIVSEEIAYESVDVIIEGKKLLDKHDDFPLVEFQELKLWIDWNSNVVGSAKGIAIKGKTPDKTLKINA